MKKGRNSIIILILLLVALWMVECQRNRQGEWNDNRRPTIRFSNPVVIIDTTTYERQFIANMPTDDIYLIEDMYPVFDLPSDRIVFAKTVGTKSYFRLKERHRGDKYEIYYSLSKTFSQDNRIDTKQFNTGVRFEIAPVRFLPINFKDRLETIVPYLFSKIWSSVFGYTYKNSFPERIAIRNYVYLSRSLFLKTDQENQLLRVDNEYCNGCDDVFFNPIRFVFKRKPQIVAVGQASWDSTVVVYKINDFKVSNFVLKLTLDNNYQYEAHMEEI